MLAPSGTLPRPNGRAKSRLSSASASVSELQQCTRGSWFSGGGELDFSPTSLVESAAAVLSSLVAAYKVD